jgi:hypothetical protein
VLKDRNENLQRMRIEMERKNKDITYKPEINQKSSQIASNKRMNNSFNGNAHERLYSAAKVLMYVIVAKEEQHCRKRPPVGRVHLFSQLELFFSSTWT